MAGNVFGTPIDDETLKGMVEYHDKFPITQLDRARVALNMKNAEGKDTNARKRAEELRSKSTESAATMGLIYNATGRAVQFVKEHDYKGHLCASPYPAVIANGQWGVFLHGNYNGRYDHSKGALVYSGINSTGEEKHWLMLWANNRGAGGEYNRVYCQIREPGHYDSDEIITYAEIGLLDAVSSKQRLAHRAKEHGGLLFTSIGNDGDTFYEVIMTLPDALSSC